MKKKMVFLALGLLVLSMTTVSVSADGYFYEDKDACVSFTVPDGWTEEPLYKERETLDVKYQYGDNLIFMFGAKDLWICLTPQERRQTPRADCTKGIDIAAMYKEAGVNVRNASRRNYNGLEFQACEVITEMEIYGTKISVTMTQLSYFRNGWIYTFQASIPMNDPLFSEVEKILNTVSITMPPSDESVPETSPEVPESESSKESESQTEKPTKKPTSEAEDEPSNEKGNFSDGNGMVLIFSILIMLAFITGLIFYLINRKRKRDREEW